MARPGIPAARRRGTGFTLVELLVALALMGLVIPVIVQGLHVASLAGEVSQRKAMAARIAEKVLNESIVMSLYQTTQKGTEQAGPYQFTWTLKDEPWNQLSTVQVLSTSNGVNQAVVNQDTIHQVTVNVTFKAQSHDYAVHLSTLVNTTIQ